jgi:hypothetical protein
MRTQIETTLRDRPVTVTGIIYRPSPSVGIFYSEAQITSVIDHGTNQELDLVLTPREILFLNEELITSRKSKRKSARFRTTPAKKLSTLTLRLTNAQPPF